MPQIIVTLGLLLGIGGSRIIRRAVVSVRENMYVHAAQSIGASTPRILWRHILPNVLPPIIVLFTTRVGVVILAESGLSFLGLGVPPPAPTWGGMLSGSGRTFMFQGPWLALAPGLCLTVVVYATNVFGDALRDCSIRACAGRAELCKQHHKESRERGGGNVRGMEGLQQPLSAAGMLGAAHGARRRQPRWPTPTAAVRRHARGRHRLRDAVGAVVGRARLELEAQPRHRPVLRAAVRRRPVQERCKNGGKHPFYADAWLPSDAIRGELAESWEWKENPLRVEIKLRKGIMFPEKPGVMKARELIADDVVFSYNRLDKSPTQDHGLLRPRRQGRGDRQAHGRVHVQGLQRRVGLPLRLGLLLGHLSRRRWSTPAPPTGRTSTAPARSC